MKKYCYKTTAFLVITLLSISTALFAQEVTKEFYREFTPRPATTLDINSRYGNVVIESWDRNLIVIEAKLKVSNPRNNREHAEYTLNRVNVEFSESGNVIKVSTKYDSDFNPIRRNLVSSYNNSISVDYNIKMPVSTNLTLVNSYGNTTINELSGLVNINISYGNLAVNKLTRGNESPQNNISLRYGNGNITEAGRLTLNTSYVGSLNISKCTTVLLESKYSKLNFGEVSSITGESRYDNIQIGSITNLDLDSRYTKTNIRTLTNSLKLEIGYGSFTADNITTGFESLEVNTRYAPVKLGIADNASYQLNVNARYGGIRYDNITLNATRIIQERNSQTIEGIVGRETSPSAKVKIDANYATVQLDR